MFVRELIEVKERRDGIVSMRPGLDGVILSVKRSDGKIESWHYLDIKLKLDLEVDVRQRRYRVLNDAITQAKGDTSVAKGFELTKQKNMLGSEIVELEELQSFYEQTVEQYKAGIWVRSSGSAPGNDSPETPEEPPGLRKAGYGELKNAIQKAISSGKISLRKGETPPMKKVRLLTNEIKKMGFDVTPEKVRKNLNRMDYYAEKRKE